MDLVSSYVGIRWEQLAASLGFRDTDDPEFSDRSGEEACRMMLTQWRDEQKGKNVRRTLSVALKELGLELLSQRIQTASETHSRTSRLPLQLPPTGILPPSGEEAQPKWTRN